MVVAGASAPDKTLALETLDTLLVERPAKVVYRLHHLCLDAGYNYEDVIAGVQERDYHLHLSPPAKEPRVVPPGRKYPARRWVVERTHSWHNRFRRLLIRSGEEADSLLCDDRPGFGAHHLAHHRNGNHLSFRTGS